MLSYLGAYPVLVFILQNAPLTEQQHAAIIALSHAVVDRPFPSKLVSSCLYITFT